MNEKNSNHPKYTNRLINEKSPYLQQHAHNPVDWFPWGEEAFEKARNENKPVFLSIGYSTCHWCHVMAHESFEDEDVAELLSDKFISIKVDREERPDIDHIYMQACQAMTGQGGWPLSLFLLPDQRPFYAGMYFPKERRMKQPGFMDVLSQLSKVYEEEPERVKESAGNIAEMIQIKPDSQSSETFSDDIFHQAFEHYRQSFDQVYGGFGDTPKFPSPQNFFYLLRYAHYFDKPEAAEMVKKTLDSMANGGIYDHVGFGFSRYSVDSQWLVPHFEKMLYDNALLCIAYVEAYQMWGDERFKKVAEEIITYVKRDMTDLEGGFYSAEDADSEGVEGKFYVWDEKVIREIFPKEEADFFIDVYQITEKGNFEGENIPNLILQDLSELASKYQLSVIDFETKLNDLRQRLYKEREKRIHPHKDDKVLTAWNGYMIAALAKASRVFANDEFLQMATKAYEYVERYLIIDDRLYIRRRDDETIEKGMLEDYVNLLWATNELYETTQEGSWLEKGSWLAREIERLFADADSGGYFFYGNDQEQLFMRSKEHFDGATPSGNSTAVVELFRLGTFTGNQSFTDAAERTLKFLLPLVKKVPYGFTHMLTGALLMRKGVSELLILSDEDQDPVWKEVQSHYYPHVFPSKLNDVSDIPKKYELTGIENKRKRPLYLVCKNQSCRLPTSSSEEAIRQLTFE